VLFFESLVLFHTPRLQPENWNYLGSVQQAQHMVWKKTPQYGGGPGGEIFDKVETLTDDAPKSKAA